MHSLAFIPTRRQTHGVPLEPAMTTEKRVDVAPLLSFGSDQKAQFRFDTASFTQGDNEVPAFVGNGLFDLFVRTWKVSCNLLNLRKQFAEGFFRTIFISPWFQRENFLGHPNFGS